MSDIIGGTPQDWLAVGWFTEDETYRTLAEKFAKNLSEHRIPYHLFSKPSLGAWNTQRKPAVVMEAMDLYPGRTIVLMDVDCIVRENIAPIADIDGDIGITVLAHNVRSGKFNRQCVNIDCSSRVVVFKPNERARAFAEVWQRRVEQADLVNDEHAMVWAYLSSPSVEFAYIDQAYSGREVGQVPDAVICHDSAHDRQMKAAKTRGIRGWLRAIERRFFRTGRSKERKLASELAVMLKAG